MTWQWVVLILGFLATLVAQGYVNVLKERTAVARDTLARQELRDFGMSQFDEGVEEARERNGHS